VLGMIELPPIAVAVENVAGFVVEVIHVVMVYALTPLDRRFEISHCRQLLTAVLQARGYPSSSASSSPFPSKTVVQFPYRRAHALPLANRHSSRTPAILSACLATSRSPTHAPPRRIPVVHTATSTIVSYNYWIAALACTLAPSVFLPSPA
jgi:hypothetical protein